MASGILSAPGSKFGPCEQECSHVDCRKTREMASSKCRICGEVIGYDRRCYSEASGVLVHASCLEDEEGR